MADDDALSVPFFEARVDAVQKWLPEGVDGLLMLRGAHSDEMPDYMSTYSLQIYLTRRDVANTVILVMKDKCAVASRLCNPKKTFHPLSKAQNTTLFATQTKEDETGENLKKNIADFEAILALTAGKTLGVFNDDMKHMKGKIFAQQFLTMMKEKNIATKDMTTEFASLLRVKDDNERMLHQKAATFGTILTQRFIVKEVKEACNLDEPTSGYDVADAITGTIEDPKDLPKAEHVTETTRAFETVVQSGDFPAEPFIAESTQDPLQTSNICVVAGVRWKQYTSLIGRTYMVNATDEQKAAYAALLVARAALHSQLKPGNKISDAVKRALSSLPESLRAHLHPELGFGTGIQYNDRSLALTADNETELKEGMMLVTRMRLGNLEKKVEGEQSQRYVLQVVDTVVVTSKVVEGKPEAHVLTNASKFAIDSIAFTIDEEEEEDEDPERERENLRANLRESTLQFETSNAGIWSKRQAEILEANKAATKSSSGSKKGKDETRDTTFPGRLARGQLMPEMKALKQVAPNTLMVDKVDDMIYFPVAGETVGVHGSLVHQTKQEKQGDVYVMRISFKTTAANFAPYVLHPHKMFFKEVALKAPIADADALEEKRRHIREMVKALEKRELGDSGGPQTVDQTGLQRSAGGLKLKTVYIKPGIAKGKGSRPLGNFTAHSNGFRFESTGNHPLDILYSNVKHLIACPNTRQHDRYAAVHVALNNPIKLENGNTTSHVHLFTEVQDEGEEVEDRNGAAKRSLKDEAQQEDEDDRIINKINEEFVRFVAGMNGKMPEGGTCDIPFKTGYFEGFAGDALGTITTTQHTICSVLDSPKFFVLTMADVEVVIFERVVQGMPFVTILQHTHHHNRTKQLRRRIRLQRLHPPRRTDHQHPEEAPRTAEGPYVQGLQQEGIFPAFLGNSRKKKTHSNFLICHHPPISPSPKQPNAIQREPFFFYHFF